MKKVMLFMLALFIYSVGEMKGQVYFDNLYGDSDAGEGVPPGATLIHGEGYLICAAQYQTEFWPSPFIIDLFGDVIISFDWPHHDSIGEQLGNVIKLNDTLFVGLSFQTVNSQPSSVIGDMVLTCFKDDGQIEWRRVFGPSDRRDVPHMVISTLDNGLVITGQTSLVTGAVTNKQMTAMKIDHEGNVEWQQFYGGNDSDWGSDLVQTPDHGFLLLGWTRSFGGGQRDFYLVKTDSLGNQQWQKTYGGSTDEGGSSIIQLMDGNYLLTGSGSQGSAGSIGRLYKVRSDGTQIWAKTYIYEINSGNNLHKTLELWNGDLISAGMTSNTSNAGYLVRTDSLGNVIWQREYDKNDNTDLFYSLLLAEDGGFLLSGQAWNEETNSQDAWLLKVDSVGCPYPNCLVGVDETEPTKVMVDVWPNPATDVLNLELQQQGKAEIRIYDMAGREFPLPLGESLSRNDGRSGEGLRWQADVSTLQNGLYLLTVKQGTSRTTVRVVVQH